MRGPRASCTRPFAGKADGEPDWRNGTLVARANYTSQQMNLVNLVGGAWPTDRALSVERQSSRYFGLSPHAGDPSLGVSNTIIVQFGRSDRQMPITGVVRSPLVYPPQFGGDAAFYATPEAVTWLTGLDGFNQINVVLDTFSQANADEVAQRVERRLRRMGFVTNGHIVTDPERHWFQDTIDAILAVLLVLGALAVFLSAFLIVNTMHALITQQTWQIGVMKVLGATFKQVFTAYLSTAAIYGALALCVAVPLGIVGAHLVARYLLDMLNVTVGPLRLAPGAVGIQVVVGLVVPVLAALRPVQRGARMTPRQAISSYGLGGEFGRGPFDRLIARIRHIPRPLALSLRNTFRRKLRVALTLLALIVGGVMFVIVMSVNSSLNRTLDTVLGDLGFDVWVGFERPYRISRLTEIASSVPGVVKAEVWSYQAANLALGGPSTLGLSTTLTGRGQGDRTRELNLWGLPTDSTLYNARLAEGRALIPGDEYALLLNQRIALDEGIRAGDDVALTISGQESLWTVVGIVINVNNNQRDCFVPFDSLAQETASLNHGSLVMVSAEQHDPESQQALIRDLRATFAEYLAEPSSFVSAADLRQSSRSQFQVITGLMLIMAILSARRRQLGTDGHDVHQRGGAQPRDRCDADYRGGIFHHQPHLCHRGSPLGTYELVLNRSVKLSGSALLRYDHRKYAQDAVGLSLFFRRCRIVVGYCGRAVGPGELVAGAPGSKHARHSGIALRMNRADRLYGAPYTARAYMAPIDGEGDIMPLLHPQSLVVRCLVIAFSVLALLGCQAQPVASPTQEAAQSAGQALRHGCSGQAQPGEHRLCGGHDRSLAKGRISALRAVACSPRSWSQKGKR